ncbi:50S ribosomal protein L34e, partial [Candidatus Woesearchaeota archaeon]|nr:50S ribosomal protein L34e [Candidatus Woesearchaeota archaeon]
MQPRLRSRTFRRLRKKTPGGRTVTHYTKRKPKQAHCSSCGGKLHGIPRLFP